MKLGIVGSLAYDTYSTPRGRVERALGGSATHAMLAAAFFTRPVGLVGVVGEDFKDRHLGFLRQKGADLEGVARVPGKTFHWKGRYQGDMGVAETLATELGVFASFDPRVPASVARAPFLFLANIDPSVQSKVLDQARPRFTLLDTMNYWIASKKAALLKVVRRVDALILNDQELRQLTGEAVLTRAARAALKLGPKVLVLKRGEHGASLFTASGVFQVPAYPVGEVKDPTGAGDSFAGGFIGSLARSGRVDAAALRQAMAYGTVMASFNVEEFSVDKVGRLRPADIRKRHSELRKMTQF